MNVERGGSSIFCNGIILHYNPDSKADKLEKIIFFISLHHNLNLRATRYHGRIEDIAMYEPPPNGLDGMYENYVPEDNTE